MRNQLKPQQSARFPVPTKPRSLPRPRPLPKPGSRR